MAVQISGNDITVPRDGTFTRNVTIGGTLTYEDVTNVDSVGLITARNGVSVSGGNIVVGSGITLSPDGDVFTVGVSTFRGNVSVSSSRVRVTGPSTITNNAQTIMAIDSADDNTAGLGGKIGFAAKVNETTRTLAAVGGLKSIAGTGNFSGDLALYTRRNGVANLDERLRITSSGQIGIGTDAPAHALDIQGSSGSFTKLALSNQTMNTSKYEIIFGDQGQVNHVVAANREITFATNGSSNERLRIAAAGQLLMGHDTASTNFHDPQTTVDRTPQIQIHGGNSVQSSAALVSWSSNSGAYYSNALYLAHSGSSTIGTNSIVSSSNTLGSIVFSGDDGDEFVKGAMVSAHVDGTPGADDMPARLQFWTNGGSDALTERMRIGSNGQVTLKPDSNLNEVIRIAPAVDASDTQEYGISWVSNAAHTYAATKITTLEYDASDSRGHLLFYTRGSNTDSAPTERMRIAHDGTVNIPGGVDGSGLLHVGQNTSSYVRVEDLGVESYGIVIRKAVSSTYAALRLVNTNGHKGNLNVSNSGVALANASDYRLKENETIISDGITKVKQLIPRRFNFKADKDTTVDGFFAHEVSPVVPESVFGEKDATVNEEGEGYQGLDQSKLIPVLTASIKELIAKVETLEAEVAALKSN